MLLAIPPELAQFSGVWPFGTLGIAALPRPAQSTEHECADHYP